MITTADLIDICSLYYVQAAHSFYYSDHWRSVYGFRCSMYALSARLILEGVY